jgi:hypothetical protein
MAVIDFERKNINSRPERVLQVIMDVQLVQEKLTEEDANTLDKIANALSDNRQVTWIWYRWSR